MIITVEDDLMTIWAKIRRDIYVNSDYTDVCNEEILNPIDEIIIPTNHVISVVFYDILLDNKGKWI
jgi:hypothetical protein